MLEEALGHTCEGARARVGIVWHSPLSTPPPYNTIPGPTTPVWGADASPLSLGGGAEGPLN